DGGCFGGRRPDCARDRGAAMTRINNHTTTALLRCALNPRERSEELFGMIELLNGHRKITFPIDVAPVGIRRNFGSDRVSLLCDGSLSSGATYVRRCCRISPFASFLLHHSTIRARKTV